MSFIAFEKRVMRCRCRRVIYPPAPARPSSPASFETRFTEVDPVFIGLTWQMNAIADLITRISVIFLLLKHNNHTYGFWLSSAIFMLGVRILPILYFFEMPKLHLQIASGSMMFVTEKLHFSISMILAGAAFGFAMANYSAVALQVQALLMRNFIFI